MSYLRQIISEDYILAVQSGRVADASIVWKFGFHTSGGTTLETVWDGSGLYTYHLGFGVSAKKVDVVSDNASDTVDIGIAGLDADGNEQSEIITLNGTTAVTSVNTYSRVFRGWNDSGTELVGDVSVSETAVAANVLAVIHASDQQTLMALYTVPLGYTGYLIKGTTNIGSGKEATISFSMRLQDKVFRTQEKLAIYQNVLEASRPYSKIPALTDIEVRAEADQINNKIGATFGILLIKD